MRRILLAAVTAAALTLTACGSDKAASPTSPSSGKGATGEITVLAAASLTEVFNQLGHRVQGGPPRDRHQILLRCQLHPGPADHPGAPADVFASASAATMKTVTDAGDAAGTPTVFVRNQIVIAVAPGNPKGIKSLADLTKPGLKVVQCAKEVPCGAAAQKALDAAKVKLTPASFEQDVKATLTKVELGEADAALVYRTDVNTAGGKGRRRQGRRRRVPGVGRCHHRLPDRGAQERPERRPGPGVGSRSCSSRPRSTSS